MKELNHETGESLEGTRNADSRVYLDENAFSGVNIYLEFAGFVDRRVEESEEALLMLVHLQCYIAIEVLDERYRDGRH
jgi:hypothetical protein